MRHSPSVNGSVMVRLVVVVVFCFCFLNDKNINDRGIPIIH